MHKLRQEEKYTLTEILAAINFPKSTYMYWQAQWNKPDPDQKIKDEMLSIREKHPNYGYRRIHATLIKDGWVINRKKVQRLCQELNIQVRNYGRKYRRYNSYKGVVGQIAPNRVNRQFDSSVPYQKITTDTTEFKYYEEDASDKLRVRKLYLDPFMDLYNLEIISFRVSHQPNKETMLKALEEAIEASKICAYRRTFHSDRGWAYQMKDYQTLLEDHQIFQSMSRKGNCYDNAPIENFFGVMKQEMYYGKVYRSYKELEQAIIDYILYYNEERIKEKLNWLSPVEYRKTQAA
ncbi:IS3 family transposase [Hutsoniella sourekii]|uniref:IS3 family transposase n=1 Tax=Hutsoniella sourekii TaxID=87650 RepID=UPI002E1D8B0C|nr:IS3 family transposase [Hutsoniella sourekii]